MDYNESMEEVRLSLFQQDLDSYFRVCDGVIEIELRHNLAVCICDSSKTVVYTKDTAMNSGLFSGVPNKPCRL